MSMIYIDCSDQPLDFSFHASCPIVAAALVDGTVEIHSYPFVCLSSNNSNTARRHTDDDDDDNNVDDDTIVASLDMMNHNTNNTSSSVSCRSVQFSVQNPNCLFAANNETLACWDLETKNKNGQQGLMNGTVLWAIHDTTHSIQIMAQPSTTTTLQHSLVFTGDDCGLVRIYDTRITPKIGCIQSCNPSCHTDYISGLQPLADGTLFLSSSADGTWALHDIRKLDSSSSSSMSKKSKVLYQSEILDDDELLSLLLVEDSYHKVFCGTQRGVVKAWKKIQGKTSHPSYYDANFILDPSSYLFHHPPHHSIDSILCMDHDTLITGCSDGYIRFFSISTHTFIGVLNPTDEEDVIQPSLSRDSDIKTHALVSTGKGYPIERLDFTLEKKFLASLTHDNFIRFYSLQDDDDDDDDEEEDDDDESSKQDSASNDDDKHNVDDDRSNGGGDDSDANQSIERSHESSDESSGSDSDIIKSKKKKRFKTDSANFFQDL